MHKSRFILPLSSIKSIVWFPPFQHHKCVSRFFFFSRVAVQVTLHVTHRVIRIWLTLRVKCVCVCVCFDSSFSIIICINHIFSSCISVLYLVCVCMLYVLLFPIFHSQHLENKNEIERDYSKYASFRLLDGKYSSFMLIKCTFSDNFENVITLLFSLPFSFSHLQLL